MRLLSFLPLVAGRAGILEKLQDVLANRPRGKRPLSLSSLCAATLSLKESEPHCSLSCSTRGVILSRYLLAGFGFAAAVLLTSSSESFSQPCSALFSSALLDLLPLLWLLFYLFFAFATSCWSGSPAGQSFASFRAEWPFDWPFLALPFRGFLCRPCGLLSSIACDPLPSSPTAAGSASASSARGGAPKRVHPPRGAPKRFLLESCPWTRDTALLPCKSRRGQEGPYLYLNQTTTQHILLKCGSLPVIWKGAATFSHSMHHEQALSIDTKPNVHRSNHPASTQFCRVPRKPRHILFLVISSTFYHRFNMTNIFILFMFIIFTFILYNMFIVPFSVTLSSLVP